MSAQDGKEKRPKTPRLEDWLDEVVAWGRRREVDVTFYKNVEDAWSARLHFRDSGGFFVYSIPAPEELSWGDIDKLDKALNRISATARKTRRLSRSGVSLVHSSDGWAMR
jgi:hypothetical protein